jgi:hypothetical protein
MTFWKPDSAGYTPSPSFAGIKDAFRPLAVIDRTWRAQTRKGQTINRTLTVVNDLAKDLVGALVVRLGDRLVAEIPLSVDQGRFTETTINFKVPEDLSVGQHAYTVCFTADSGEQDQWSRRWRVAAPFAKGQPLKGISLAVVGQHAPINELEALGASVTRFDALVEVTDHPLILLGRNVIKGTNAEATELRKRLSNGTRFLFLEQSHSVFPTLEMNPTPYATAWTRALGHPLLKNITDADLCFWGDAGYASLDGDHIVVKMGYTKADGAHALALADSGEGGFGTGNLGTQPLLEVEEGPGLMIANQFFTHGRYEDLPVAETLLVNAVRRLKDWQPSQKNDAESVVFSANADPKTVMAAAHNGQDVLVEGFHVMLESDTLKNWSQALGVKLEWVSDEEKHWQAVYPQSTNIDPLFQGINLEDLCGIETWTYAKGDAVNHPLSNGAFLAVKGLEPLWVTPTQSGLREMMVHQGKTEPLRAHTSSRFVYGEERPLEHVLMARVRIGSGSVLLSCLTFPENYQRMQRARNRLLANLGVAAQSSALDGERSNSQAVSKGFANVVKRAKAVIDEDLWTQVAEASGADNGDRCWTQPWSDITPFERLPAEEGDGLFEDGKIGVGPQWQPGTSLIIGTTLSSPRTRKDMSSDIGIPNPEEQLFCDFKGTGEIEAVLNGVHFGRLELNDGVATLPDLELLMGRNHLVLRWWPTSASDTLRIEFRDIMRHPDTSFRYG